MHVTSLIAHRNLIFLLLVEIRTSYVLYVCYIILLAWITKLMCLKNVMKDFTIICRIYRSVRLISHHNVNIPSYTENCDSEKLHVFSKRYKVNIMGFIIEGEVESTSLLLYRVFHSSIIWVLYDSDEEIVLIVFEIWVKLFINKYCWQDIFN